MSAGLLVRSNLHSKRHDSSCCFTVKLYLVGLGGNHPIAFFLAFVCGLILTELSNATQTWYLGYWASQYDNHPAEEVAVF